MASQKVLWELKFIRDEVKVVWPFLAGFGIWNYLIYSVDKGADRNTIENSKYYQQVKWVDIKNSKYGLEEILARQTGTFKELDMKSFAQFADQVWNYQYWNDPRPDWDSLSYADGTAVSRSWVSAETSRPTFAEHRQWRHMTISHDARKANYRRIDKIVADTERQKNSTTRVQA